MNIKERRASLARKMRATSARYKYRAGVWAALADVALDHCNQREVAMALTIEEREREAVRAAVEPVIEVLLEANRLTAPLWLRGEKLSDAIEMLSKLRGEAGCPSPTGRTTTEDERATGRGNKTRRGGSE